MDLNISGDVSTFMERRGVGHVPAHPGTSCKCNLMCIVIRNVIVYGYGSDSE